ncbi:hypothetical protein BTO06_03150 [Tenacibaculum sp. SZ-18]|uniref:phytase n=1 Tax=Tenacibaculum sp. SZ-18 TaxID=754423 RepID=UPI000CA2D0EB|nr:phytase [Tenacibaculum sp. SZ-18]AUC14204.1 hypothetical protein BTO06_03150 [Tenacibaculum sp. SZ-18]
MNKTYAIVSRKEGPNSDYLYQYELVSDSGEITSKLVRKYGNFSGKIEIKAIVVDNELGFIYSYDEQHYIRKYYAKPQKENEEVACFAQDKFKPDIEGIAIAKTGKNSGYIIVSDQQRGTFNIFDRESDRFIKAENLTTLETDGCDVTTISLNSKFSSGLFVAMNDEKNFFFYDFDKLLNQE